MKTEDLIFVLLVVAVIWNFRKTHPANPQPGDPTFVGPVLGPGMQAFVGPAQTQVDPAQDPFDEILQGS